MVFDLCCQGHNDFKILGGTLFSLKNY